MVREVEVWGLAVKESLVIPAAESLNWRSSVVEKLVPVMVSDSDLS